jgi:hypothetical protein
MTNLLFHLPDLFPGRVDPIVAAEVPELPVSGVLVDDSGSAYRDVIHPVRWSMSPTIWCARGLTAQTLQL